MGPLCTLSHIAFGLPCQPSTSGLRLRPNRGHSWPTSSWRIKTCVRRHKQGGTISKTLIVRIRDGPTWSNAVQHCDGCIARGHAFFSLPFPSRSASFRGSFGVCRGSSILDFYYTARQEYCVSIPRQELYVDLVSFILDLIRIVKAEHSNRLKRRASPSSSHRYCSRQCQRPFAHDACVAAPEDLDDLCNHKISKPSGV